MNSHMPMTNNDCDIPVLLVATQMMESLASLDITQAKGADVQQLANAAALLLRDG